MSKTEWTDEQIAESRQEWSYEINDEMLSDEQIMALPYHYEPHTHEEELADYADALLACQRLERQLSGARIILEEMYDWLPLPADDVYRRMKATLKAEAEDAE